MLQHDDADNDDPTLEEQILRLMDRQAELARQVKQMQAVNPRDSAVILQFQRQHRDTVNELINLLYLPLKQALERLDTRLHNAGAQYTEMVHDFFLKLYQRRVSGDRQFQTFTELRQFVARVLMNQFQDHLRRSKTFREHRSAIAPIAEQKQQYFEKRYGVPFIDFLDRIAQWECSEDLEYQQAARVAMLHYVSGENWGTIAGELEISDERVTKLRKLLAREFFQRK